MTKQQDKSKLQNKLYGAFIIICAILEFLSIVGAYVLNYFTRTRMGMLRHVVYLNGKWEKLVPVPILKVAVLFVILALLVIACNRFRKIKSNVMLNAVGVLLVLLSIWTICFLIFSSTRINRSYYILSMCFVLATMLQNIIYHCLYHIRKINYTK